RIKAGITDARKRGKAHGRPRAQANDAAQIRALAQQGLSQAAIARHLGLWRTSVRRGLAQRERARKPEGAQDSTRVFSSFLFPSHGVSPALPSHPSGRKALMLHYILTTLLFAIGELHLSTMKEN